MSESSQNNTKNGKLLPCPFCGGEAQTLLNGSWWCVACRTPFCCDVGKFDTESEAIAAWNTRAERTCEVRHMSAIEQTINLVDMITWGVCEECLGLAIPGMNYCPNCGAKVVSE